VGGEVGGEVGAEVGGEGSEEGGEEEEGEGTKGGFALQMMRVRVILQVQPINSMNYTLINASACDPVIAEPSPAGDGLQQGAHQRQRYACRS
jgi:hypothetical protein